MSPGGRSIPARLSYHYTLNNRFVKSRQGKKNAKVKDTGRVKYIAMERRTPPAGAKAAACVYPGRSTVSRSCRGNIIYQSVLRRRSMTTCWGSDNQADLVLTELAAKPDAFLMISVEGPSVSTLFSVKNNLA